MLLFCLYSCTGKTEKSESTGLQSNLQTDSILAENEQLNFFINTLSESMDSILTQESYLMKTKTKDGVAIPTRVQVLENLSLFKDLVYRQHKSIEALQDSMRNFSSASADKVRKIISFYKQQLNEKDLMITKLNKELDNKNADISRLSQRVSTLNNDISDLSMKNQAQEEALKVQDNIINECYVLTGTKKELQKAGVLSSSGIFKKKQLNLKNFNPNVFRKVDIRNFTEITINGKNPVVLTQMPTTSYKLEKVGKNAYTLNILDPTTFWSVSNYLVILYN